MDKFSCWLRAPSRWSESRKQLPLKLDFIRCVLANPSLDEIELEGDTRWAWGRQEAEERDAMEAAAAAAAITAAAWWKKLYTLVAPSSQSITKQGRRERQMGKVSENESATICGLSVGRTLHRPYCWRRVNVSCLFSHRLYKVSTPIFHSILAHMKFFQKLKLNDKHNSKWIYMSILWL